MYSRLILANGTSKDIAPENGREFTLEELQGLVGGYIESVCRTKDGHRLFVNEDGKRLNLPLNETATLIYRSCVPSRDFIVGDAVLIANHHIS